MPRKLKRNAVLVFGLAALFWWVFMSCKHVSGLRSIIPFGEDPYDAVGSFAAVIGMLLALVSLVRAFRPYTANTPSETQRSYLLRAQEAVVLAVLITLATDVIAMARHPSMWISAAGRNTLIVLLGGLGLIAFGVERLIRSAQPELTAFRGKHWKIAAVPLALALLVLAFYPERLLKHTLTHVLSIAAGAVVLFAPMRPLLIMLVPYTPEEERSDTRAGAKFSSAAYRWTAVLMLGVLIGAFAFAGEMSEGGRTLPLGRVTLVACVFIASGLAGLVTAYSFLAKPLGFRS